MNNSNTRIILQIENLDDCTNETREFLRVQFKALAKQFDALALYCDGKNRSSEFRLAGDIQNALLIENRLETVYAGLNADLQW